MIELTSGDFLAGGGGVTHAMKKSGLKVKWVLNHNQIAIRTNMHNNKGIKHYLANFYTQDEHEMEPVDFVWASIECTQHSRANGGREKKIGSYTLGWELLRYVRFLQPSVIGIENVPEFKEWAPLKDGKPDKTRKGEEFEKWKAAICALGYDYSEYINNAADFGIPTRRVRYFAFFTKSHLQLSFNWPEPTHSKDGKNGLQKWVACKSFIDLTKEGESIFGRKFNPNIKKGHRKELCPNTHERIAGGIDKYAPELSFIFQYYGNGKNVQSLQSPLNAVTTKDRHVLVTMEKLNFIADHCHTNSYNSASEPLNPILTRQTKQLVTVEKQFLGDYYGRFNTAHSLDGPANTITTENSKHLVSTHFISHQYNSNGNPVANNQSIDEPLNAITSEQKQQFISHHFGNGNNQSMDDPMNSITTKEKIQFITAYYSSSGKQGSQNQSIDSPLGTITTGTNKQALISAIESGEFDFDIRMRFLDPEELGLISTFPERYFTDPLLKLTKKEQTKLIGNAVPPEWAKLMIEPVLSALQVALEKREVV
jgi:DNA (cytosine-5)-methyltransferase 1